MPMYQMIADVEELRWFFDNAINRPLPYESYSMVFASRFKNLTQEEREEVGITRRDSEFLSVQVVRAPRINHINADVEKPFTFENFLRHVRRFNVDKYAYTTSKGEPLPDKTLVIIMYVNPADDIKVADKVMETINDNKTAIVKAAAAGKRRWEDVVPNYQNFGNLENNVKHFKAQCKGTRYWLDYDVDVPQWFKDDAEVFAEFKETLNNRFGKGNYIIVDTRGGYHVLVKVSVIKFNPHLLGKEVEQVYKNAVETKGYEEYEKFECVVNDSQIPGLPLPGTYQYGRPVTVINKEDFVKDVA